MPILDFLNPQFEVDVIVPGVNILLHEAETGGVPSTDLGSSRYQTLPELQHILQTELMYDSSFGPILGSHSF